MDRNGALSVIRARIPANKFSPPVLGERNYLERERLHEYLRQEGAGRQVISISGRAGQGKSVFAAQLAARLDHPFAWYQIGPEDGDAVLFLAALLCSAAAALPGFASPTLEKMIEKGEVSSLEFGTVVNLLLGDLGEIGNGRITFVLEDVHRLEAFSQTRKVVEYLIETSPPSVCYIITSRIPTFLELPSIRASRRELAIGNDQLAFTREESELLYRTLFHHPLSTGLAAALQQTTAGWAMGVVLLRDAVAEAENPGGGEWRMDLGMATDLLAYLRREVLVKMPTELQCGLVKLAHLPEIPFALTEAMSGGRAIVDWLERACAHNLFVRAVDTPRRTYFLHHLLQELLCEERRHRIGEHEMHAFFTELADHYLHAGEEAAALEYLLRAGDLVRAESLLDEGGAATLLSGGGKRAIERLLEPVPPPCLAASPWLSFLLAESRLDVDPPSALAPLRSARRGFSRRGEVIGELLALAELVRFHVFFDGRYHRAAPYLMRSRRLLRHLDRQLDDLSGAMIYRGLGYGALFVDHAREEAEGYFAAAAAAAAAEAHDFVGLATEARVGLGYCRVFDAGGVRCIEQIESVHAGRNNPRVGAMNRLTILVLKTNFFEMRGDLFLYRRHAALVEGFSEGGLVAKTVFGPFLLIWEIDTALAEGRVAEALEGTRRGLTLPFAGVNPHLRSQFLHYRALCLALLGERESALSSATEALALRRRAGGRLFVALTQLLVGAAHAHLQREEDAERLLGEAIQRCEVGRMDWLRATAHLHRAAWRIGAGGDPDGDVRCGLQLLREGGFLHYFGSTPDALRSVLGYAVSYGVETEYARLLAAERLTCAIMDDGTPLPLLEFETSGGLIVRAGGCECDERAFSAAQRELLTLLLSHPGSRLDQERVQEALWPEASPAKGRARLDTLLSRLRKGLRERLSLERPEHYVVMEKGVVALRNRRLDAERFEAMATEGLRHAARGNVWLADNAFHCAFSSWGGHHLRGVGGSGVVARRREVLDTLYLRSAAAWADLLDAEGEHEAATARRVAAHRLVPTDDATVRALHAAYRRGGNPAAAARLVKEYREALRREEYAEEEIDAIALEVVRG